MPEHREQLRSSRNSLFVCGLVGAAGALLVLLADVVYNVFDGDRLGGSLYITTYFGIFLFPLWWAGIWVLYQGLRPAGVAWSLFPCLLFAYILSTVNVAGHASYPFWAVLTEASQSSQAVVAAASDRMQAQAAPYTLPVFVIQTVLEAILSIWIAIPILRGRSFFPRWFAALIPIFPLLGSLLINRVFPGFFEAVEPYVASACMSFAFAAAGYVLSRVRPVEPPAGPPTA